MIIISTPEHTMPVYLCRFAVRSYFDLLEVFLVSVGSIEHIFSLGIDMRITLQG